MFLRLLKQETCHVLSRPSGIQDFLRTKRIHVSGEGFPAGVFDFAAIFIEVIAWRCDAVDELVGCSFVFK